MIIISDRFLVWPWPSLRGAGKMSLFRWIPFPIFHHLWALKKKNSDSEFQAQIGFWCLHFVSFLCISLPRLIIQQHSWSHFRFFSKKESFLAVVFARRSMDMELAQITPARSRIDNWWRDYRRHWRNVSRHSLSIELSLARSIDVYVRKSQRQIRFGVCLPCERCSHMLLDRVTLQFCVPSLTNKSKQAYWQEKPLFGGASQFHVQGTRFRFRASFLGALYLGEDVAEEWL